MITANDLFLISLAYPGLFKFEEVINFEFQTVNRLVESAKLKEMKEF